MLKNGRSCHKELSVTTFIWHYLHHLKFRSSSHIWRSLGCEFTNLAMFGLLFIIFFELFDFAGFGVEFHAFKVKDAPLGVSCALSKYFHFYELTHVCRFLQSFLICLLISPSEAVHTHRRSLLRIPSFLSNINQHWLNLFIIFWSWCHEIVFCFDAYQVFRSRFCKS